MVETSAVFFSYNISVISMYSRFMSLSKVLSNSPDAIAIIKGSKEYKTIIGTVYLYDTDMGVIVVTEVSGLSTSNEKCSDKFFAFHIHGGEDCSGTMEDPFSNAMSHYDPYNCPHPHHAGDLAPLLSCNGKSLSVFLTDRFTVDEVIGRTIVIHSNPDDFTTQPSGNSGEKIACGIIRKNSDISR